jgi:hypothetical protein
MLDRDGKVVGIGKDKHSAIPPGITLSGRGEIGLAYGIIDAAEKLGYTFKTLDVEEALRVKAELAEQRELVIELQNQNDKLTEDGAKQEDECATFCEERDRLKVKLEESLARESRNMDDWNKAIEDRDRLREALKFVDAHFRKGSIISREEAILRIVTALNSCGPCYKNGKTPAEEDCKDCKKKGGG